MIDHILTISYLQKQLVEGTWRGGRKRGWRYLDKNQHITINVKINGNKVNDEKKIKNECLPINYIVREREYW